MQCAVNMTYGCGVLSEASLTPWVRRSLSDSEEEAPGLQAETLQSETLSKGLMVKEMPSVSVL